MGALVLAAGAGAQEKGALTGVVKVAGGSATLAYASVAIPELGVERFTDAAGRFTFTDLPSRSLALQVRRIGFSPKDLRVTIRPGATEDVNIELDRFAVALEAIRVRAHPPCKAPGPPRGDTSFVQLFTQVALNAQQYRVLAEKYPFRYAVEVVAGYLDSAGAQVVDRRDTVAIDGLQEWRYRPGRIVSNERTSRYGRRLHVNLPTLVDIAGDEFIRNHCFHYVGLAPSDSGAMYRIDFVAADRIRGPDFSGEIYLDSSTFQIRRSVLRVENGATRIRGLKEMSLTTDFAEVLPSIPVIARLSSWQEYDRTARGAGNATGFEFQQLLAFRVLGRKPGQ